MASRTIPHAVRETSRAKRANELANLRDQLPVHTYLELLHTAAMTGSIPDYDYEPGSGKSPTFTGTSTPLAPKERVKVLAYLIDKALPTHSALKPLEETAATDVESMPLVGEHESATIASLMATLEAATEKQKAIGPPDHAPSDGETVVRERIPQPERIAKLDVTP